MNTSIFRSILIGILLGILAFVAFRFVLVLLLIGAIFSLSGKGRWKRHKWREQRLAYVESVRNMNDDEFENFKSNFGRGHHCH